MTKTNINTSTYTEKVTACQDKIYEITSTELPLCCPMPNMELWDAHPRVYLPIEETGREACPYCGATYILKGFETHDAQVA